MSKVKNMVWGYIPATNLFEDMLRKAIGLPNPGGRLRALIVKNNINNTKRKILDCGCGSAMYSIELAKKGFHVTGVEIDRALLLQAQKNSRKMNLNILFILCDIRFLPFQKDSFNQMLCIDVLEHIPDVDMSLAEISRTLEKNGILILTTTVNKKRVLPVSLKNQNRELGHVHLYLPIKKLRKKFQMTGFDILKVQYFYKFFSLLAMELVYWLMGARMVKHARHKVHSYNPAAMIIFCILYPIMLLDRLLPSKMVGREALILASKI